MRTKILPVIHYLDDEQAYENAARAFDAGCDGVFLIHMSGGNRHLAASARQIKEQWPDKLVGINYLNLDTAEAVKRNIADGLDMTWTDEQLTHSTAALDGAARTQAELARQPGHQLFVGVAFKHQAEEPRPDLAARGALACGFVPCTSGPATGVAAEVAHVAAIRAVLGPDEPLAIASGITPDNVAAFAPHLSHILVATGVSSSYYEFDYELLCQVRARADLANAKPDGADAAVPGAQA